MRNQSQCVGAVYDFGHEMRYFACFCYAAVFICVWVGDCKGLTLGNVLFARQADRIHCLSIARTYRCYSCTQIIALSKWKLLGENQYSSRSTSFPDASLQVFEAMTNQGALRKKMVSVTSYVLSVLRLAVYLLVHPSCYSVFVTHRCYVIRVKVLGPCERCSYKLLTYITY